jgi:hypothetical protein
MEKQLKYHTTLGMFVIVKLGTKNQMGQQKLYHAILGMLVNFTSSNKYLNHRSAHILHITTASETNKNCRQRNQGPKMADQWHVYLQTPYIST